MTTVKNVIKRAKKATSKSSGQGSKPGRPLTARAVAELCGVELKTIHNWAVDGRLPHFRTPGRHLRFQPEVVEAFLRECGYEINAEVRLRVVCVAARPAARLRKALANVDCMWVPDVWTALIEVGRAAPDVWVVDATNRLPDGLTQAVETLKRQLPSVKIAVLRERAAPGDDPKIRYLGIDGLMALLTP